MNTRRSKHGGSGSRGEEASGDEEARSSGLTIVGIGASAGGLAALKQLFAAVPAETGVAFVVVVHLSPSHESRLAEILQPHCRLPVQQVNSSVPLEPDRVYVIPPNANLEAIDTHLRLSKLEEQRRERAPIDHFFRTLAAMHDGHAIGVVLTGSGSDGTLGLRWIKEEGGVAIAQLPAEAEHDSMPRNAIASGLVDLVLPLREMPAHILRIAHTQPHLQLKDDGEPDPEGDERTLHQIFAEVRARTGHDFGTYRRSTIMRRIRRRMQLHHMERLPEYLRLLRHSREEQSRLFDDLLITVTEFFRDPEVFEQLAKRFIPPLFERKGSGDQIRVWSVGCSTGEEAYSLAMLLLEEAARRDVPPTIQVFATDLHAKSLRFAREGLYPEAIASAVSADRLERFFTADQGGYRVRREVRERVVFAPHDLLKDPPFSRMDLVACRNVLIYLQRPIQQDVLAIYHYALNPDGLLLLGSSETPDGNELFQVQDKDCRIFRRRGVPGREPRLPRLTAGVGGAWASPGVIAPTVPPVSFGALHARMVERYAPPSVLVSERHEIVHHSAHAGEFLQVPGGEPTQNIFKLVRDPLRVELRAALHAAAEAGA
jgi:two-component system CheB/CheR fusion protein